MIMYNNIDTRIRLLYLIYHNQDDEQIPKDCFELCLLWIFATIHSRTNKEISILKAL